MIAVGRAGGPHRLILLSVIWLAISVAGCGRDETGAPAIDADGESDSTARTSSLVQLYFPSERADLRRESRDLPAAEDVPGRIRQLVEALLTGPENGSLFAPFASDVELAAVHFTPSGIAYLDFEAPEADEIPSLGSRGELLTVYSIVDSVLLNVDEVKAVVLLWNGSQRFSLAGHVDTSGPLTANLDLVAGE